MTTTTETFIQILKYREWFTLRTKDYKKQHWFSFPNDMLLHPDFDEITGDELKWFIWVVSVCSRCKSDSIRLNVKHAIRKLDMDEKSFHSMCEKLKLKQIKILNSDEYQAILATVGIRPDSGHGSAATEQNRTEQTEQNNIHVETSKFDVKKSIKTLTSNQSFGSIIARINPEIVRIWASEYQIEWLCENLAKAVVHHLKKNPGRKVADFNDWDDRLNRWLNGAINPRKTQTKASEDGFFASLELETPKFEVVHHD